MTTAYIYEWVRVFGSSVRPPWAMLTRQERAAVLRAETWRRREEADAALRRAELRARKLFRQHLTKAQLATLKSKRWIEVKGNHTGHVYRIDCRDEAENIRDMTTGNRYCCVALDYNYDRDGITDVILPRSDHLLAQKLAIELHERKFRRIVVRVHDWGF